MAGLIQGDLIEIYHVLRPGVCVCGRVSESFHLHSVAKIDDSDWPRLLHSLTELYKVNIHVLFLSHSPQSASAKLMSLLFVC